MSEIKINFASRWKLKSKPSDRKKSVIIAPTPPDETTLTFRRHPSSTNTLSRMPSTSPGTAGKSADLSRRITATRLIISKYRNLKQLEHSNDS